MRSEPYCHCGCSYQILDDEDNCLATIATEYLDVVMAAMTLQANSGASYEKRSIEGLPLTEALDWTFSVGVSDAAGARAASQLIDMLPPGEQAPWRKKLANAWFR